jgi:hypothetical protein
MQRFFILLLTILLTGQSLTAQYKRYPTLEHFTNTWCSSCASRNPALFTYLTPFAGQYHHMTIHPNIPYQGCLLYQANTTENNARKTYYGVSSTPRVYMNGTFAGSGNNLVGPTAFTAALQETSPIGIQVTETTGNSRTATIKVHSAGQPAQGSYVLHVAVVEKTLNYASPNGEQVHHNVFRRFLTPVDGLAFTPAANGAFREYTYDYTIASNWNAPEMYVLAFVQEVATKRIENSGTRFDNFTLSANDLNPALALRISPNPAQDFLNISTEVPMQELEVFNMAGRRVFQAQVEKENRYQIALNDWKSGMYLVRVTTASGSKTERVVVE